MSGAYMLTGTNFKILGNGNSAKNTNSADRVWGTGFDHGWNNLMDFIGFGTEYRKALYNELEAQKQRDWEQYMAENSHQIEVEDLKKAGINPVMTAIGGTGAPVPSGATASAPGGGAGGVAGLVHALTSLQIARNNAKMVENTNKMLDISKMKQANAARALESKSARETAMRLASFFLK